MGMPSICRGGCDGNPNPANWNIIDKFFWKDYLVLKVNYPNCTNYNGDKIIVFKGIDIAGFYTSGRIDPHFSENSGIVARFAPGEDGMERAIAYVKSLNV